MGARRAHAQRERGYIYYHGHRTARLAAEIGVRSGILRPTDSSDQASQEPLLYVGALFHDIGKGFEHHNITGASITRALLSGVMSSEELDVVCDMVRCHCLRRDDSQTSWVKLVQDADLLDHFGTQEVWLKFQYSAVEGESCDDALAFWRGEEWSNQVQELRGLLNYSLCKELYDERIEYVRSFVERFAVEAEGRLFDEAARDLVAASDRVVDPEES